VLITIKIENGFVYLWKSVFTTLSLAAKLDFLQTVNQDK